MGWEGGTLLDPPLFFTEQHPLDTPRGSNYNSKFDTKTSVHSHFRQGFSNSLHPLTDASTDLAMGQYLIYSVTCSRFHISYLATPHTCTPKKWPEALVAVQKLPFLGPYPFNLVTRKIISQKLSWHDRSSILSLSVSVIKETSLISSTFTSSTAINRVCIRQQRSEDSL